ncbi:hypothetical protein DMA15_28585 [Streptomyces sp. WAC 01529]|nr:hypothetical protein DMA15_28585 [Streptomyces sp. WAC 01529]
MGALTFSVGEWGVALCTGVAGVPVGVCGAFAGEAAACCVGVTGVPMGVRRAPVRGAGVALAWVCGSRAGVTGALTGGWRVLASGAGGLLLWGCGGAAGVVVAFCTGVVGAWWGLGWGAGAGAAGVCAGGGVLLWGCGRFSGAIGAPTGDGLVPVREGEGVLSAVVAWGGAGVGAVFWTGAWRVPVCGAGVRGGAAVVRAAFCTGVIGAPMGERRVPDEGARVAAAGA